MAKYIISAGHTLPNSPGSGAVGYINESEETRKVVAYVKRYLEMKGHKVVVVNVDYAVSQSMYLYLVSKTANKHSDADIFLSLHFNSGGGRGSECYTWRGNKLPSAVGICDELSKLGFRNRGLKDGSGLYVISKTEMPAVLAEVCFVDSREDCELYKKLGVPAIAQAITRGILKK